MKKKEDTRKEKVHFVCEVVYRKKYILIPGQAVPIQLLRSSDVDDEVELHIHTSLWKGNEIYTDIDPAPLSPRYIRDNHLGDISHTHSTKNGYGTTILNPTRQSPGSFSSSGRTVFPSSLTEVLELEDRGAYVAGAACYAHLIPGIYARLTPGAPEPDGTVSLWDVKTGEVAKFVRLPLPLIIGAFDTFQHQRWWQVELMRRAFAPYEEEIPFLYDLLEDCEYEGKVGIFDPEAYYYALPGKTPREGLTLRETITPKVALLPHIGEDAWEGIDLGRRHVKDWREAMRYFYKA